MGYERLIAFEYVCDSCGVSTISSGNPQGYLDKWKDYARALLPAGWVWVGPNLCCSQACAVQKKEEIDKNEICPECGYRFQGVYDVRHASGGHIGKDRENNRVIATLSV